MPALKKTTKNWIATSDYDIKTAQHMLKSGRYIYVIFMCHLAIEKLLKAVVAQIQEEHPPRIHDPQKLALLGGVEMPMPHQAFIAKLNALSIATRYPEDLQRMVERYPKAVAQEFLDKSQGFARWLKRDPRLRE
jgi:HEPN domain-containing protein